MNTSRLNLTRLLRRCPALFEQAMRLWSCAIRTAQSAVAAFALLAALCLLASPAHAAPGNLDVLDADVVGTFVNATAVQPDGKTIIGGLFSSVLGVPRNNIARLNADGTLDMGFDPKANGEVSSVAVQADGKVLLVGGFSSLQPNGAGAPTARFRIARVNADGTLDTGFDPQTNSTVISVAVQADGKVLVSGQFTTLQPNGAVSATARNRIARLNADGTLDTGFDPNADNFVSNVAVQADGKVLLVGGFTMLQPNGAGAATARVGIARVNADGTLDTGFDPKANGNVNSVVVQADGKVLLGGEFTTLQPNGAGAATARNKIARVNADGTLDTGFDPQPNGNLTSVAVQADGKVLVSGQFTTLQPNGAASATARNNIARVNADGTLDTGFDPKANGVVLSVAVQADGKVLLGGFFSTLQPNGAVSPTARNRFARLVNDPATQTLSAPDTTQALWTRGGSAPELSRVTFEQSTDGGTVWTPLGAGARIGTTANWQRTGLTLPASGQLRARGATTGGDRNGSSGLIEQVVALGSVPGDLDVLDANVVGNNVRTTAVQPDGKTILAGSFTSVLGVPRQNIARLNADGTLDAGFDPKANGVVFSVAVQADGKVLLGGGFTTLQPNGAVSATARQFIARVNADGTLDMGFDPNADGSVFSLAVQADGKVLLGGQFSTLQPNGAPSPTDRQFIARVNADGTLDTGFDPKANIAVYSVAVQADGKVLLGGSFTTLQPNGAGAATARQSIARVNADGTLDAGFDPKANSDVYSVAVQADGKVLLGGFFTTLQPNGAGAATARERIARVNADGTLDVGFDPKADNLVLSVVVQADGKVLLGGGFFTLQPNGAGAATARNFIARVNADGTLDPGFDPKANIAVYSVAVQADGKVLLGGDFTTLQPNGAPSPTTRNLFARLLNDPATQTLSVPNMSEVLWQRGGAGPELARVTFELSTDGGTNWTPLGAGTRIGTTANWQRTGLSLPASGQLRARGATTAGQYNGSSGLIEQAVAFPPDTTTLSPLLTAPAPSTVTGNPVSVAFTLPEAALPGSVTLSFGATVLTLAASQETSGAHAFTFAPANPTASAQIASGGAIADGTYTVTLSYQDALGHPAATAMSSNVAVVTTPTPVVVVGTDTDATGAGLPTGTKFASFGAPDVGVFGGKVLTPAGQRLDAVFSEAGTVLLSEVQMVAVDPAGGGEMGMITKLAAPTGDAVLATLDRRSGATAENDQVLFVGLKGGVPKAMARKGQTLAGLAGVKLKSFLTLDGNGATVFFSGKLSGAGVNSGNNTAILAAGPISGMASQPESGAPVSGLRVLVRKGDMVDGRKVKIIATLVGQAGTLAEGRWRGGPNSLGMRLTFTNRTQALYLVPADATGPADWLLLGQTDSDAGPDLPGAKLLSFNLPAHAPGATVFDSVLKIGPGEITRRNNAVAFDAMGVETGGPISLRRLAQRSGPVPSPTGVPVAGSGLARLRAMMSGLGRASSFVASSTLPGERSARDTIYDARADGQVQQLARIGGAAPGGGRWARFVSVAKPDGQGSGALVSALLAINGQQGVTAKNRAALYARDSGGEMRRLLRTGDQLESAGPGSALKAVKSFVAISAAAGSIGAARGYDDTGKVSVLVTFADRTQAVVRVQVP